MINQQISHLDNKIDQLSQEFDNKSAKVQAMQQKANKLEELNSEDFSHLEDEKKYLKGEV